ncbi:bifunctional DNA-formamidopyrimidine glycosylase/DNA-(apurinic or apyrimidinic site) lyase [Corynebacterium resistens]|uniref:bifunctional DNA-formamidopyrimidine glycosylase/DNA-(apurinic or apyrimidinic site) lyase n=1 Tax=Corynebacterium resistens TaxID=258224 RepID=UPI00235337B3|nr:bifunctional DNA-formamidopyrimidine glycosylase/DNA-(apurinic or apyrimidinic site) lyase [Corynebacterium resistens]
MPELPEVEVVRRGLESHILGRRFASVEVFHPRAVRGFDPVSFSSLLDATRIRSVDRRGKYLWMVVEGDSGASEQALFVHLGMSGQMLVNRETQPVGKHERIRATFTDGSVLSFVDQRTFGRWAVMSLMPDPHGTADAIGRPRLIPEAVAHVAMDPLETAFTEDDRHLDNTITRIKAKNSEIKRVLLDQTVIAGIGNIYADEALFAAGIRPRRRASGLSRPAIRRTIGHARAVMLRALDEGGTSFDSLYVNVNGSSGYFSRSLQVYGREGKPCKVCGTPIKRVQFGGRSSHYCPVCQR